MNNFTTNVLLISLSVHTKVCAEYAEWVYPFITSMRIWGQLLSFFLTQTEMSMSHTLLCQDQADKDSSYKLISALQVKFASFSQFDDSNYWILFSLVETVAPLCSASGDKVLS